MHRASLSSLCTILSVSWVTACAATIPDGTFACDDAHACPPGLACGADGLCWRAAEDAGPNGPTIDSGMDAGDASPELDAGPTDAGAEVDAAFDPCTGRLFCDGFEDGFTPWEVVTHEANQLEIVTSPVHSGASALRVVTLGAFFAPHGVHADVIPPTTTDIWFRAFYFVPDDDPLDLQVHNLGGPAGNSVGVHLLEETRANLHTYGFPDSRTVSFDRALPRDAWLCIEVHVERDLIDGAYELYFDDERVVFESEVDTVTGGELTTIHVGTVFRGQPGPAEIFVDDVAVDTARIGCAR